LAVPPPSSLGNVEAKEPSNVAYRLVDGRFAERSAIHDDLTTLRQLDALHL
jgi:hypothetical protein